MATINIPGTTFQAFDILNQVNETVNTLLNEFKTNDVGYKAISEVFNQIHQDIQDARNRAANETIRIGLLGGRGSGKSTLANALIGEKLLPESAIVFCTSIPTTIKFANKYELEIKSTLHDFNININSDVPDEIREKLREICKESENPNNIKQVTKITVGVPNLILDGKEIVDVPGFTKGNALHQAFAEKYAKYYCDLCLVLLNNAESVEIDGEDGLAALCKAFRHRLDSTAFIINKVDLSSRNDIEYLKGIIKKNLGSENFTLFEVSSQNALSRNGDQFSFPELNSYMSYLSGRKLVFIVKALIQRLIANFRALQDLCKLSDGVLSEMHSNIGTLMNTEFTELERILRTDIKEESKLPEEIPALTLMDFTLPHTLGAIGPYDYAKQLITALGSRGEEIILNHAQNQQAFIFKSFNAQFEKQINEFDFKMHKEVENLEEKFGVKAHIATPNIVNNFRVAAFNPTKIESLKPWAFRLWVERIAPNFLSRDLIFWKTPISLKVGLGLDICIAISIPIGIKSKPAAIEDAKNELPKQAISLMNEYLLESLSEFVGNISNEYEAALNNYLDEWKKCLRDYERRIQLARVLTEPNTMKKTESTINELTKLLASANNLTISN